MQKFPMILAGKHSTSNQDLPVRDKYTQEIIATVPLATPARVAKKLAFPRARSGQGSRAVRSLALFNASTNITQELP